ncbi:MAG: HD-GYP domain-containing protein [Desulfobacteraceae bacterium]|nr:HD-GYP domain-containing protein [Desulfobacteraceae bacterium]
MTPDFHQYFTLFARISKKIHANSDTRDILACIVENITRITEAKGSIFWLLYFMGSRTLFDHELELVTALGEQGAIALEKAIGYDQKFMDIYQKIVEGFALAIDARDRVTHGHSRRVARLSRLTARQMGLSETMVKNIFHAGILHDIGKIGTRDTVLERLGHLTSKEMKQIRQHPVLGADILLPLTFFCDLAPMIRHHHERLDGSGYPDGIKGENIPLGARILAVCDVFETMTAGRPGMPAKDLSSAVTDLQHGAGTLFDPTVVQAFFAVIQAHPDALEIHESVDDVLDMLRQNMAELALGNRLEKQTARLFPPGF